MATKVLTISQDAAGVAAASSFKQAASGVSPQIQDLSVRVQNVARECLQEYQHLCERYSTGASDPELMEILSFSQKETNLLSHMSSEEKAIYHRICDASVAARCPHAHNYAVQVSQHTEILKKFPTEVPTLGDGNCGLYAFAHGYVDQMNADDVATLQAAVLNLGPVKPDSQEAFVLDRLNTGRYSVADSNFMMALAKVLRKIGHNGIPEYYRDQIAEMGNSEEVRSIISNLIPQRDHEWVDHEGLICLGHILGKRVCVLREMSKNHVLVGDKEKPDIVINHRYNHFTARQRIR
jgi:hypothetical protein